MEASFNEWGGSMIFVTVGTHEQPFDRLIRAVDQLKAEQVLEEEVVIQTGYSTYEPVHCTWKKLFPYQEMLHYVREARIVITHGGPSSFIMPLQVRKVPIVVPRQKQFGEHVNDHQLEFAKAVAGRYRNIIVVEEIEALRGVLLSYDVIAAGRTTAGGSHNKAFNEALEIETTKLMRERKQK